MPRQSQDDGAAASRDHKKHVVGGRIPPHYHGLKGWSGKLDLVQDPPLKFDIDNEDSQDPLDLASIVFGSGLITCIFHSPSSLPSINAMASLHSVLIR